MTHGRSTTLVVNPEGLTALTMAVTGAAPYAGSTPYLVPLNSIRIHENERRQIVYAANVRGEGGRPVRHTAPLVPFEFDVVIIAGTEAGKIDAYNDLQAALLNDRGGTVNLRSPGGIISKNAAGQATSGYLCEVEKVTLAQMEEWKKQYPEAFEREYDPASGLRFNAWVEGGM